MDGSRRRLLRIFARGSLWVAVALGAQPLLGRALAGRYARGRRRHPDDLSPIPWIGHC
jgi:hypothetical protein